MTPSTIGVPQVAASEFLLTRVFEAAEETLPLNFQPLRLMLIGGKVQLFLNRVCFIFGRHSLADIQLNCPFVSRRHCEFLFSGGTWHLKDLGSLNGTLVNNSMVELQPLKTGDRIEIVGLQFQVELSSDQLMQDAISSCQNSKPIPSENTVEPTPAEPQYQRVEQTLTNIEYQSVVKKRDDEPCAFSFPKISNLLPQHSWHDSKEYLSTSEENR